MEIDQEMNILVILDQYLYGGREDFLRTYVESLREWNHSFSLLTTSVNRDQLPAGMFSHVIVLEQANVDPTNLTQWLDAVPRLRQEISPDIIWVQHSKIVESWLIAKVMGIPLIVTFHCPPRLHPLCRCVSGSLDVALGILNSDEFTGVSREVLDGLAEYTHREGTLLPNLEVAPRLWVDSNFDNRRRLRVGLLARTEKLHHLGKGIDLFLRVLDKDSQASLHICGLPERRRAVGNGEDADEPRDELIKTIHELRRHFGRKWLVKRAFDLLFKGSRICLHGVIFDTSNFIRSCDIVLGMGRVMVESMIQGRVSILIGYQEVHGIISAENFEAFRYSNFSGRGCDTVSVDTVIGRLFSEPEDSLLITQEQRMTLDIANGRKVFAEILSRLGREGWRRKMDEKEVAQVRGYCELGPLAVVERLANSEVTRLAEVFRAG